jgi:hypothetical protein
LPESPKEASLLPILLAGGTSLPFALEIAANNDRRYEQVLQDMLEAPRRTPGERVVTADAKSFIEKRAAMQQKTAGGAGSFFGAVAKLPELLVKHPVAGAGIGAGVLGLGALAGPTLDAFGEKIKDTIVPDNQRDTMLDQGANAFAKAVGSEAGKSTVGLFGDMLSKAMNTAMDVPRNMARQNMFQQLQGEDDVLAQADPQSLQEAYHTMVRFAPTLATDKNAVRSFLRESVLYGTGPNVVTIKQLADSERAATGER